MKDLSTSEMVRRLRDLMRSEQMSLRAAVESLDWDYQATYFRLTSAGWAVRTRTTLVKVRKPRPSKAEVAG
jgi:hypothetical protein